MLRAVEPSDLRRVSYLAEVSDSALGRLLAGAHVDRVAAREVVALEGEPALGCYVVRTGKARIIRANDEGREQTLRLLGPGESFGEVCIFDGGAFPATVQTIEESEVIAVPAASFHAAVLQEPGLGLELLAHFSRRLRSFNDLVAAISLQTVQARLARYLYQLAREEGSMTDEGLVVPRTLTVQDLASLLGSAREVVSRSLKTLADDGIVEIHRGYIVVRDAEGLRALV